MDGKSFGEKIRALRFETGKTMQSVADDLGMAATQLGTIERGDRKPLRGPRLKRLAQLLNADYSELRALSTREWMDV